MTACDCGCASIGARCRPYCSTMADVPSGKETPNAGALWGGNVPSGMATVPASSVCPHVNRMPVLSAGCEFCVTGYDCTDCGAHRTAPIDGIFESHKAHAAQDTHYKAAFPASVATTGTIGTITSYSTNMATISLGSGGMRLDIPSAKTTYVNDHDGVNSHRIGQPIPCAGCLCDDCTASKFTTEINRTPSLPTVAEMEAALGAALASQESFYRGAIQFYDVPNGSAAAEGDDDESESRLDMRDFATDNDMTDAECKALLIVMDAALEAIRLAKDPTGL